MSRAADSQVSLNDKTINGSVSEIPFPTLRLSSYPGLVCVATTVSLKSHMDSRKRELRYKIEN